VEHLVQSKDLQSWGRLRQTCRVFHQTLDVFPTLRRLQSFLLDGGAVPNINSKNAKNSNRNTDDAAATREWKGRTGAPEADAVTMFGPCLRRVLFGFNQKMDDHIKAWERDPPAPQIVTRDDGQVVTILSKKPGPFDLKTCLAELDHFVADACRAFSSRKWFFWCSKRF
jgi:hypothetical protein